MHGWLSPKAAVRVSRGRGSGVFAVEAIEPGELVAVFAGVVVGPDRLASLPEWQRRRVLQVHEELYLVSVVDDDPPDFINHSCAPNCGFQGNTALVAMRLIGPGDELTYDYAMSDSTAYDEFGCHCGFATCRGSVTGDDWQRPDLQLRYRGFFSSYLEAMIAGRSRQAGGERRRASDRLDRYAGADRTRAR